MERGGQSENQNKIIILIILLSLALYLIKTDKPKGRKTYRKAYSRGTKGRR